MGINTYNHLKIILSLSEDKNKCMAEMVTFCMNVLANTCPVENRDEMLKDLLKEFKVICKDVDTESKQEEKKENDGNCQCGLCQEMDKEEESEEEEEDPDLEKLRMFSDILDKLAALKKGT